MKVEYVKDINRSFLVIREREVAMHAYDVQMSVRGIIKGFVAMECVLADGQVEYWYDITGKQSLEILSQAKRVDAAFLRGLTTDMVAISERAERYLLDPACICLEGEFIFFDPKEERFQFCYIPGYEKDNQQDLEALLEQILRRLNHADEKAVEAGYAMYQKVATGAFCMSELLECFAQTEAEPMEEPKETSDLWASDEAEEDEFEKEKRSLFGRKISFFHRKEGKKAQGLVMENFAERIKVAPYSGTQEKETVFLANPGNEIQGQLIYQGKNGQDHMLVNIDQPNYFIGSNLDTVDGYIRNENVSRIHARIFLLNGEYYVEDLNSTNGTKLNGRSIVYRKKEKLHKNDRLTFATEEYIFY